MRQDSRVRSSVDQDRFLAGIIVKNPVVDDWLVGWIDLVNLVERRPDNTIVINTGARNQTGVSNFGKTLNKALPQLGRTLVVLWMIDRKRESLALLSDFSEAIPEATIHVVRNMYLGSEKKFELYNGSKMRAAIEAIGGRSLSLPEFADRMTDAMNTGRLTIDRALAELSLGDRMELERWAGGVQGDAVGGD